MPEFRHRFTLKAPLEAVIAFHQQPQALVRLTPPPLCLEILYHEPLGESSRLRFRLSLGPFSIFWEAIHREVDFRQGFTDEQVHGPLKFWRHRHTFIPLDANHTVVEDHIQYTYRPGWRHLWTRVIFSPLGLRFLFAYRQHALARALAHRETP